MRPKDAREIVLEGVLIPTQWGPSGEVQEVGLMTFDENQYHIDPAAVEDHGLRHQLRRHVRLSALVQDGRVIQVRRFEMLGDGRRGSSRPDEGHGDDHSESGRYGC